MIILFPPAAVPPVVDLTVGQVIEWQQQKCKADSLDRAFSQELIISQKDSLCEMVLKIENINSTSAVSGASLL